MNKLSTMLFQVVTVEQCCNNMLTILFIVGRTTLFTPVDINLEQVVDFLNFYTRVVEVLDVSSSILLLFLSVWLTQSCMPKFYVKII